MSLVTPRKGYKSVPWLFGKEIEIPQEWEIKKLETLVDILDSKRIPLEVSERKKRTGKYPYYGASGIIDHVNDYIFDERILCLSEDGENLKSRVLPIAFTVEEKCWVNNHAHVLKMKENVSHYFIEKVLNHISLLKYVASTAIPKLNQRDMRVMPIICPTFPEQQKIATILSNVDNLIESTGKVITHSKKVKTGLMQKLLTRGIGHVTFKKVPWLFGKEIEIPEEWELTKLEKMMEIKGRIGWKGYTVNDLVSEKKGVLVLGGTNISKDFKLILDKKTFLSMAKFDESPEIKIQKNDIILVQRGNSIGSVTIIDVEIGKATINPNLVLLKNIKINNNFLSYFLMSKYGQIQIFSKKLTNAIPLITQNEIKLFKLFIPPLTEQQKIASILSNIDSKITSQEQYKEKLQKLKKSLMQKLLTGEVRV